MTKSNLFWGGAVASGLLLTAVVAQETTRRPAPEGAAGREAEAAPDPASMKPIDHFLAGYYAGYSDGYLDGGEDTAVAAVERQRSLAAKHAADGQHDGEMQPGRRDARESLRAHMRGEDEARTAGQAGEGQADEGPEETVSGTVVGIKEVPIEGTQLVHRVVRLETEEGRRQVADLGPTDQTDKLGIKEGDELRVQGVPVDTPDVRIIAGHRVFKGDQEAHVHYPGLKVTDDGTEPPVDREGAADRESSGGRSGGAGRGAGGSPE